VVLVEYPRRGLWSIAFVTGSTSSEIQTHMNCPMVSIVIPTSPNPTTGWYAVVPEEDVINLSISIEDAFKIIISGGIVDPTDSSIALPKSKPQDNKKLEQPLPEIKQQQKELEQPLPEIRQQQIIPLEES